MDGWSGRSPKDNKWRVSRPLGCLLWLVLLLVILLIAAVLFGGFQTGTKVSGVAPGGRPAGCLIAATSAPGAEWHCR